MQGTRETRSLYALSILVVRDVGLRFVLWGCCSVRGLVVERLGTEEISQSSPNPVRDAGPLEREGVVFSDNKDSSEPDSDSADNYSGLAFCFCTCGALVCVG